MPGSAIPLCDRLSSISPASGGADLPSPVSLPSLGPAALPPMKEAKETGESPEPAFAVPVGPAAPPYRDRSAAPLLPVSRGVESRETTVAREAS